MRTENTRNAVASAAAPGFVFSGTAAARRDTMSTDTRCTLTFKASVADLAPDTPAALAAWMQKFGKAAAGFEPITLTADADRWVAAGCPINSDGTVRNSGNCCGIGLMGVPAYLSDDLRMYLRAIVERNGDLAGCVDADPMLTVRIAAIKKQEQDTADRIKREAEAAQAKAAAIAAAKAEEATWIAAHGSARLRRCLAEGIECSAAYRDERLALERVGWRWADTVRGSGAEPRNPTDEAFDLLDLARTSDPEAKLVFWTADEEVGDDTGDIGLAQWREYAAVGEFLGRAIVFGGPAE
jgi:hypothetical protein